MPTLGQSIRLDLNNVQTTFFERCAGTARFTYNWGLAEWKRQYEAGEKPTWQKLNKELNSIKSIQFPWMYKLPWTIPNVSLSNLGSAFKNFFRRVKAKQKPGYPKFKKKGRSKEAFSVDSREIKFNGKRLKIPKFGWVRMYEVLRFPGKIMSVRFTKHADHWYVSISVEIDETKWSYPHICKTQTICGVDLGVVDLAVLSNGFRFEAPRSLRQSEKRLRMLDKELSRRKKGGKNRGKTKQKLGKLHERIANVRKGTTHKLTATLAYNYRWIGIEDLAVSEMLQNKYLEKSISDAALREIRSQLEYKSILSGSNIVVADRWFPSSKTCSTCGEVVKSLPLSVRNWTCSNCRTRHDRDENAAKNLKQMAAAFAVTACRQGSAGPLRGVQLPHGQELSNCVTFG